MSLQCHDPEVLAEEERIVWREPPERFPYLREGVALHAKRRGPIAYHGSGRVVGWAECRRAPEPPHGYACMRRFWWFADHDPYPEFTAGNRSWHPAEAVEPTSIRAGGPSISPALEETER